MACIDRKILTNRNQHYEGMSTSDVVNAVEKVNNKIALMQCNTNYNSLENFKIYS